MRVIATYASIAEMEAAIVEVKKNPGETTASLLRRFTKRVQGAGFLRTVRSNRYASRSKSEYAKKKEALRRIAYRKEREKLWKLGKLVDAKTNVRR